MKESFLLLLYSLRALLFSASSQLLPSTLAHSNSYVSMSSSPRSQNFSHPSVPLLSLSLSLSIFHHHPLTPPSTSPPSSHPPKPPTVELICSWPWRLELLVAGENKCPDPKKRGGGDRSRKRGCTIEYIHKSLQREPITEAHGPRFSSK